MKDNSMDDIMKKEIEKRLENDLWDMKMSRRVMSKRRSGRKKMIYSATGSSLALAATVTIIFMFGFNSSQPAMYDQFISSQIEGTYKKSFEKNIIQVSSENSGSGVVFSDDLDDMIDDTLAMR